MVTTKKFADQIGNLPTSIHHQLCKTGSYFGVRPVKLPNGRLLWPDDAVEQLIAQRSKKQEADHAAA